MAAVTEATMRAAVLVEPGRVELRCGGVPSPARNEVLVRLEGCGVCGSNLPLWEGRPWFSYPLEDGEPGHEGWGVVEELGPDTQAPEPGTRVALLSQRAFAEYDLAPVDAVVALPDELEGPFPGEALGCALNVFRRAEVERGCAVAVVGIGFLGALLVQLAAAEGANVTALSRRQFPLDVAAEAGAGRSFGLEELPPEEFDVVIEAAGAQETLDVATRLVRTRGRLVVAGYHQDGTRKVDMQLWNWKGIDVVNAHERDPAVSAEGMRLAIAAVADGRLDPAPLVTHRLPLDRVGEAFELARSRPDGFLKAVVVA
jgi:threonine dehydrogenase-like Zn-dependent dehydrogenase